MKALNLNVILLLISFKIFAQIEKPIDNPKKITFIYKTTPNLYLEDNTLYADTLLLHVLFPNKKYLKVSLPTDSSKIVGKILKSDFKRKEIIELRHILYYSFFEVNYVYNVYSKSAKISESFCKTQDCTDAFKTFFNKNNKLDAEHVFRENKYLDEDQIIEMKAWFENSFTVKKSFSYKDNFVKWTDTINHVGNYARPEHNGELDSTAKITADPTLDKHITPIYLFSNCEYGLREIKSKRTTTKLIKVVYE